MMKKTTLISLAGLALLPLSNVSYADYDGEQKAYAGSGCEPIGSSAAAKVTRNPYGIFALDPVTVRCPIVRDNVSNLDGTKSAIVFVEKREGVGNDKDVFCILSSNRDTGGLVEQKSAQTLESRAGAFALDVDVNASRPGGPYALVCTLPTGGGINSYIIAEY